MGTETDLRIMVLSPYYLSNNFGGSLLSKFIIKLIIKLKITIVIFGGCYF